MGFVPQTERMRKTPKDHHDVATEVSASRPPASPGRISGIARTIGRLGLGIALAGAGTAHLTTQREEFQAQVPNWVPVDHDFVVVASGVVEIGLGTALVCAPRAVRPIVGLTTATFFVAVFPGNIAQYVEGTDAFGLDTDQARLTRLFFQPGLVAWALWSTNSLKWLKERRHRG